MLVHQGNEIDGIYDPDLERDYNEIDITRIRQVALLAGKGAVETVGAPIVGTAPKDERCFIFMKYNPA